MQFDVLLPIFIARDEQVEAFRSYLQSWYTSIADHQNQSNEQYSASPPIPGLVVLVHGHGGMGKSTLLKQYGKVADAYGDIVVGSIINCRKTQLFQSNQLGPQADNGVNIRAFFADLADKLACALHINGAALREYRQARQALHNFREQLKKFPSLYAAERQQEQVNFARSRRSSLHYARDTVSQERVDPLLSSIAAFLKQDSDIPSLWRQEIEDIVSYSSSYEEEYEIFWEPGRLLGEALGRDLRMHATDHPFLLFFDAYEHTIEEDACLRVVMRQAGERVGWVIASQADLWSGYDSMDRHSMVGESYQDIITPARGLSIDLNSPLSGFFSATAISLYFKKLCDQQPSLPALSSDQLKHITQITRGIPLGVRILAELYIKDLNVLTKLAVSSPVRVVDQLMVHYLASPEQKEILQLCGLALLHHKKNTDALLTVLGLSLDQQSNYEEVMTHLSRHADFIFDGDEAPFLHEVVRSIIRQWLLKHRYEPDKRQLFSKLQDVYYKTQQKVERTVLDMTISDLFATPQWVEASLDLIEILFWIDGEIGMLNALPFLIVSSVYNHAGAQRLIEIVAFFEPSISKASFVNWQEATIALSLVQDHQLTGRQKVQKLNTLADNFIQQVPMIMNLVSDHRKEISALLYWKAGDASLPNERHAKEWYLKAWQYLNGNQMLQHTIVQLYLREAYRAFDRGQYEQSQSLLEQARDINYKEADIYYTLGNIYYIQGAFDRSITYYQYAIIIDKDKHIHVHAYMNLANTHYICKEYERAIHEYNRVQELAPEHVSPTLYYNRANAYAALGDFAQARDDYDQAIQLDPQLAWAYGNRGYVHARLEHYAEALTDYKHAAKLAPDDINVVWTATWATFSARPPQAEDGALLLHIAQLNSQHYARWICQAVAAGIQHNDWSTAQTDIERAIELAPEEGDPHLWKGLIAAYLGDTATSQKEVEQALQFGLPPLFLTPLRWLQKDCPNFFAAYIEPLLRQYHL